MSDTLNIENVDSTPTIPVTNLVRVRLSSMASELTKAQQQGYIEANVLQSLLTLVKDLAPNLLGV